MRLFFLLILVCLAFESIFAQDLLNERIRRLPGQKMSTYLSDGIFHNGMVATEAKLLNVRHRYDEKNGIERVVFDFSSQEPPRIYGHISVVDKKIYFDFFNTTVHENFKSLGTNFFVKGVDFYPVDKESLSTEISLQENVIADIFTLSSPARLVIDIKK